MTEDLARSTLQQLKKSKSTENELTVKLKGEIVGRLDEFRRELVTDDGKQKKESYASAATNLIEIAIQHLDQLAAEAGHTSTRLEE